MDRLADKYNYYSVYQFAGNEVPNAIDLDGLEPARVTTSSRVDHKFIVNREKIGNSDVNTSQDIITQTFVKVFDFFNSNGTVNFSWTQTVTTTATIARDGSVSIEQNESEYFDNPKDQLPMSKIGSQSSNVDMSNISEDLRNKVSEVVTFKKKNGGESPLEVEAKGNENTKNKIHIIEEAFGLGSSLVSTGKSIAKSGTNTVTMANAMEGGFVTVSVAMTVAAVNEQLNLEMPSNAENIVNTSSQKRTTTNYPGGVKISKPNAKELDKK